MADAACGPSTALQSFQKHSQQDRTLQQDRLVSRASPSQDFRTPSQTAGVLDQEFEAFQAGQPISISTPPTFFQQHHHVLPSTPSAAPLLPQQVNAAPDWALDFQRLNISSPPTVNASPTVVDKGKRAAVQPAYSGMAMEPMQQHPFSYMSGGFGPAMGMGFMDSPQQSMMPMSQAPQPTFDAAAFERAFDAATAEIEAHQQIMSQAEVEALMSGAATTTADTSSANMTAFKVDKTSLEQYTIATEPTVEKDVDQMNEADALAHTAGQLLHSVSHETSDKFAQSSFLALMRRLRDGEIKVEGENLIESSTHNIANTTGTASAVVEEPDDLLKPQGYHGRDDDVDILVNGSQGDVGEF